MSFSGGGRVPELAIRVMIRGYQLLIRPILPPSCRFYPSCSHYAAEAVTQHGTVHGSWLALRRVLRCHPWGGGGYDPVPLKPGR
jgi:putative membrane protein insertion efficiency factor